MNAPADLTPEARAALLHALAWQIELGADECVGEAPSNRFEEAAPAPKAPPPEPRPGPRPAPVAASRTPAPAPPKAAPPSHDGAEAVTEARALAAAASDLVALKEAMAGFEGCELKQGARKLVFADGNPAARVMFIGEAPGRDEDREGKPFVGRSGQLLDRMLAAIGLDRRSEDPSTAAYIANVLPWRPAGDRDPTTAETLMLWTFLERHIELAAPEIIVALGRSPGAALCDRPIRITRERGRWISPPRVGGRPLIMTLHPAYLLRQPAEKAKVWRDLLMLRAALDGETPVIEE
ncbi:MAG: uracil-DNA glycosylase [Pseudomonadota bacterium]